MLETPQKATPLGWVLLVFFVLLFGYLFWQEHVDPGGMKAALHESRDRGPEVAVDCSDLYTRCTNSGR